MNKNPQIATLIVKCLKSELNTTEQSELHEWLCNCQENRAFFSQLTSAGFLAGELNRLYQIAEQADEAFEEVWHHY